MVDVIIMRNKKSALLFALSKRAQIEFEISFMDIYKRDNGEKFILRPLGATDDLKKKFIEMGLSVKEE
jgi:hypothetical protein